MNSNSDVLKKQHSARKIQEKLGLKSLPDISITNRQLFRYDDEEDGLCRFEREGLIKDAPPGYYCGFSDYIQICEDDCPELFYYMNKDKGYKIRLSKIAVHIGHETFFGGFNWLFIGTFHSGQRFCAVIYLLVTEPFTKCGLSSLLKEEEIRIALLEHCDFIQTYHHADNPCFNEAIIPSLHNGFFFYHGSDNGGCEYEDTGYIHLRKYLNPAEIRDIRVSFKDGTVFESPARNQEIIDYLLSCGTFPGRKIAAIERSGVDERLLPLTSQPSPLTSHLIHNLQYI